MISKKSSKNKAVKDKAFAIFLIEVNSNNEKDKNKNKKKKKKKKKEKKKKKRMTRRRKTTMTLKEQTFLLSSKNCSIKKIIKSLTLKSVLTM